jgi:ribosome-associated protein
MTGKEERSLDLFFNAIDGMKALNVIALDVRTLTSVADIYIICSGSSSRQVIAIADHVKREMKKSGIRPFAMEGKKEGHWILLDYSDVVIHIFYEPVREFYDIEGLWADAKRILP